MSSSDFQIYYVLYIGTLLFYVIKVASHLNVLFPVAAVGLILIGLNYTFRIISHHIYFSSRCENAQRFEKSREAW